MCAAEAYADTAGVIADTAHETRAAADRAVQKAREDAVAARLAALAPLVQVRAARMAMCISRMARMAVCIF